MNEYLEAIILGIIQGITEFLPISSDGHLELAKWVLGNKDSVADSFLMTIVLHFGTAFAIVWVFRHIIIVHIQNLRTLEGRKFLWLIILSMIPAVIVGVGFESQMMELFTQKIYLVATFLMINGVMLILSDHLPWGQKPITPVKAFIVGIFQAIAILPGISRSGSTIVSSVAMGIDRKEAANFSFLMVLPLIFGKMAKDLLDQKIVFTDSKGLPLLVGFICALVVGIFACKVMIEVVKKAKLSYFGFYCILVGILAIIFRMWVWPN